VITVTGWTWEYVGAMAFCDIMSMFEYWADCPPEHLLFRGFVGYEGKKKKQAPTPMEQRLVAGMPGYSLDGMPDWRRTAIERELNKMKKG